MSVMLNDKTLDEYKEVGTNEKKTFIFFNNILLLNHQTWSIIRALIFTIALFENMNEIM